MEGAKTTQHVKETKVTEDVATPEPQIEFEREVIIKDGEKANLNAMLLDPDKQERIEIKVIKKLHEIDTECIFADSFYETLLNCEKIRRKPFYHGKKIPIDENDVSFLTLLAKNSFQIPWAFRIRLYSSDPQIRHQTLKMIRSLNDIENEFGVQYKAFFNKLNQVFYYSRRLLTLTIAPQIIKKYGIIEVNEDEIKYSTVNYFEEKTDENTEKRGNSQQSNITVNFCEFQKGEINYACLFREKQTGVHFGAFIEIGVTSEKDQYGIPVIEADNKKIYFLKSYHGYPAFRNKTNFDPYAETQTIITTMEYNPKELRVREMNINEPFIYKLLENLQVGPIVHFMINPYINNGFYIVTEDLNTGNDCFLELKDGLFKDIFGGILETPTLDEDELKLMCDLAEMNLLTNILGIGDIKPDNIGFAFPNETEVDASKLQIRIIDFLDESDSKNNEIDSFKHRDMFVNPKLGGVYSQCLQEVEQIYNKIQFLSPNITKTKKEQASSKDAQICNLFKAKLLPKGSILQARIKELCENLQTVVDKQFKQTTMALQQLRKRCGKNGLAGVIKKTEKDLKDFFDSPSILEKRNLEIIYPREHDLPYDKMINYCQYISARFNNLESFITKEYKPWLDEILQEVHKAQNELNKK